MRVREVYSSVYCVVPVGCGCVLRVRYDEPVQRNFGFKLGVFVSPPRPSSFRVPRRLRSRVVPRVVQAFLAQARGTTRDALTPPG